MVVLCAATFGTGFVTSEDYSAAAETYTQVNDALVAAVATDEYAAADETGRAVLALAALAELEAQGLIQEGTIAYEEGDQVVSFRYANGARGGIVVADAEEGTTTVGTSAYVQARTTDGLVAETADVVSFDITSYPYEEKNLEAIVVQDLGSGYESQEARLQEISANWTAANLDTATDTSATVAELRTQLSGFDLVVLQLHGLVDGGTPMVYLQESTTETFGNDLYSLFGWTFGLSSSTQKYYDDLAAGRIGMYLDSDGTFHYALAPEFFTYYYGDDGLEGAIVWVGCCDGYTNSQLVAALAACGAAAVLGCTETVYTDYDIALQDAFVYALLYGNTVEEALDFAQDIWGSNDSVWYADYFPSGTDDGTPSEVRVYNGEDATLVTLTAEADASVHDVDAVLTDYATLNYTYLAGTTCNGLFYVSTSLWTYGFSETIEELPLAWYIADFDSDGQSELLIIWTVLDDDDGYHVDADARLRMYEVDTEDMSVKGSGSVITVYNCVVTECEKGHVLWGVYEQDGQVYIAVESWDHASYLADGTSLFFEVITYNGKRFSKELQVSVEGSDFLEEVDGEWVAIDSTYSETLAQAGIEVDFEAILNREKTILEDYLGATIIASTTVEPVVDFETFYAWATSISESLELVDDQATATSVTNAFSLVGTLITFESSTS